MNSVAQLTQIRKHIRVVVVISQAGALERVEFRGCKDASGDGQGDRLVKPLLAGKANTPIRGLVHMLVTKTASAFYTFPQGWILTAVGHKISDDHFTLLSHIHLIMKP